MNSIVLRTASRLLVPMAILLAAYIYFKGHQSPGGGFVAGLAASVGLVVHRMAEGAHSLRRRLRVTERLLIAVGLLLALSTGVAALLVRSADRANPLPFMTSGHGHVEVAGTAVSLEWATAMAFDLGVALLVTGTVLGMINALSDEVEQSQEPL